MAFTSDTINLKHRKLNLYYELHGNGPIKLLLIMGLNATCDCWDLQTKYFAGLGHYQVCVFDNRGIGRTSAPIGRYTTQQMAHDTLALLKEIEWYNTGSTSVQDKVHVVGISMGGMVAQELALLMADQLGTLTLVATHAGHFAPQIAQMHFLMEVLGNWLNARPRWLSLPYRVIANTLHVQLDMLLYSMFSRKYLSEPAPTVSGYETNYEYIKHLLLDQVSRAPLQSAVGAFGQLMAATTHRVHISKLKSLRDKITANCGYSRVLVMAGTNDKIISSHHALYLAETLGGRVQMFVGSGHGLNLEKPDDFNACLRFHIESFALRNSVLMHEQIADYGGREFFAEWTSQPSHAVELQALEKALVPRELKSYVFIKDIIKRSVI